MHFEHSGEIWRDFPALVPGVMYVAGITGDAEVGAAAARFTAIARQRLAAGPEGELPEIQAWRRAFAKMGLKPTQYRCASESLLRRLRKEGSLPELHPLVSLCNAISVAFAIPVAVFDAARVSGDLVVRHAGGDEKYLTFSGEVEHPGAGEVIFADQAGQAHARRWTNRQSGLSAVGSQTAAALIVAEALHDTAAADIRELMAAITAELAALWPAAPGTAVSGTAVSGTAVSSTAVSSTAVSSTAESSTAGSSSAAPGTPAPRSTAPRTSAPRSTVLSSSTVLTRSAPRFTFG